MAASPLARRPCGVNVNANGTGVHDGFMNGGAESVASRRHWKTSMWLPLAFVVTISLFPKGVKPTWPGEVRKLGGLLFARPRDLAEPGIGRSLWPVIQNPLTIPSPPEFRT